MQAPREYVLDYLAHSFPTQLYEPFIEVIARERVSALASALRWLPETGVGWYFGAMPA
jgi:hypothetical protein